MKLVFRRVILTFDSFRFGFHVCFFSQAEFEAQSMTLAAVEHEKSMLEARQVEHNKVEKALQFFLLLEYVIPCSYDAILFFLLVALKPTCYVALAPKLLFRALLIWFRPGRALLRWKFLHKNNRGSHNCRLNIKCCDGETECSIASAPSCNIELSQPSRDVVHGCDPRAAYDAQSRTIAEVEGERLMLMNQLKELESGIAADEAELAVAVQEMDRQMLVSCLTSILKHHASSCRLSDRTSVTERSDLSNWTNQRRCEANPSTQ
eukprot:5550037-Pyramimonas_sp.AAC.1